MEQEYITEGNKLIAEFMGDIIERPDLHPENGKYLIRLKEPKDGNAFRREYSDWNPKALPPFHLSFNWLMLAVEKIEVDKKLSTMMYNNKWDNRGKYCFSIYKEMDENKDLRGLVMEHVSNNKIEAVYQTVVEYLKIINP